MDSFEFDLAMDGLREGIRLLTEGIEAVRDRSAALEEARTVLVSAYNAFLAVPEPDDGPEITGGMEF